MSFILQNSVSLVTKNGQRTCNRKVHNLMVEYQHLFALNDIELGKMSMVKHKIKLGNLVPFKDQYRCFPPTQI